MLNRRSVDSDSYERHVVRMGMKAKKRNKGMARIWVHGENCLIVGLILKAREQIL